MAELEKRFGAAVRCSLTRGDRGVFEVTADGRLVYSKIETGRFPQLGEVADEIAALLP